ARTIECIRKTRFLEDVPELEVHLPTRRRLPRRIGLIESISQVDPERTQRRHQRRPETRTPEQLRGIEVAWTRPQIPGVVESVEVQLLVHAKPELRRPTEERIAEGGPLSLKLIRVREITERSDRELGVTTERFSVLDAAHGERLRNEERARVAEHR